MSTLRGFCKSIRQSISWNKVDSDWIFPLLLSSCHLIIDPLRISHVTYHELERWSLKKDFHRHCELWKTLGCSGITTRIMRRTHKILFVFTVCEQQMNKYSVLMRFCGWSRGSRLNCAFLIRSRRQERRLLIRYQHSSQWAVDTLCRVPRENETSSFKRTWVVRKFGAVRHWVHDDLSSILVSHLVTTNSIWIEPGFCS